MSKLFETSEINGMKLANRFVRSATWEGMAADDGACTPKLIDLMAALAKGGVGLIVSSHAYVSPEGQAGPWQVGVYDDKLIPGLQEMTAAVHENGGKIVMQLANAGYFANPKLTGQTPMAPSNAEGFAKGPRQEMTADDIQGVVKAYGAAAKRAQTAGFDGVQIHSAHGYLLPVLVKMNCQDFIENGLSLEDSLQAAKRLVENGIDAIELSGGVLISPKLSPSRMGIKSEEKEAYFQNEARAFKNEIKVPLILVGGNRSFQVAERLVNEGLADYLSMSRPLIREPGLINRWKSGDLSRATCVSDNMCFMPAMKGKGIYCLTEEKMMEKKRNSE